MTHLLSLSVQQNPNVGLYGFANDKVCFVGTDVSEEDADKIEKVLKVPVHRLSVYRSSLVGAFATGNNSCILLPAAIEEHELTVIVSSQCKTYRNQSDAVHSNHRFINFFERQRLSCVSIH